MINALIATMNHTRGMTLKLVSDLTDDQLCVQPAPKTNHGAWVLAHLLVVEYSLLKLINPSAQTPAFLTDDFRAAFGNKSTPVADKSKNPSKEFLIKELASAREQVIAGLKKMTPEQFNAPHPDPARRERFPTLGDNILLYATWHEAYHSGQLSAWRRVQGLPAV